MVDDCGLQLLNDPTLVTRIGLHPHQQNTSPDTSHGIVRDWAPYSATWGSDHFPILITLRSKCFRTRQRLTRTDWGAFRAQAVLAGPITLSALINTIQAAQDNALEDIERDSSTPALDAHMANLWKRAHTLTARYNNNGKRHSGLVKLFKPATLMECTRRLRPLGHH